MAVLVGIKHSPVLRAFYESLRVTGKPFKVAATAGMRKLFAILNAMLHRNRKWNPQHT